MRKIPPWWPEQSLIEGENCERKKTDLRRVADELFVVETVVEMERSVV